MWSAASPREPPHPTPARALVKRLLWGGLRGAWACAFLMGSQVMLAQLVLTLGPEDQTRR